MHVMGVRGWSVVLLAAAVIPHASAQAAVFTLNPVADAFVSSANPSSNYGGAGAVAVSASGLAKGELRSVLMFDTSGAKATFDAAFGAGAWSVQSVTLTLTAAAPNNPTFNASAAGQIAVTWMQNDSWTEGTGGPSTPGSTGITWNTLPTFLSAGDQSLANFSFSGATSGATAYPLSASSGVLADLLAGTMVSLYLVPSDTAVSGVFNSRSFGTIGSRPVLSITVPEPACLVALLPVAAMLWRTRKGSQP